MRNNDIEPLYLSSGKKLIREQAGYRPGKSCTGKILNLTQLIENGLDTDKITGVVFGDLSVAYDMVNNHLRSNLTKLKNTPIENLYILVGIVPPHIRRSIQAD